MAKRRHVFILGNRDEGYSVSKDGKEPQPWIGYTWDSGRIVRSDSHHTRPEAVSYIKARAKHYRGMAWWSSSGKKL